MAKIRVMSNQRRVGRVGDTTYYVRDGEQIARQSRNNSNYGESASRSFLQQARRVKWANLVNLFKAMRSWQPKAYEFKKKGQTDYNTFMSLNINSTEICLTKDMAQNGCACWDSYQISRGSISPIQLEGDVSSMNAVSSLVTTLSISGTTTIGELSADIIANNLDWEEGDNLAIIGCAVFVDSRNYPYSDTNYIEMTLNSASTVTLGDAGLWNWIGSAEGRIIVTPPGAGNFVYTHCALIHTRKVNGSLLVSTQALVQCGNSPADQYKGSNWLQECIDTYGESVEVPLDPSFPKGTIRQVTANGAVIEAGAVLSGSQTIRVYGTGAGTTAIRLTHNDTIYAPLSLGDDYAEYIIGSNGSVSVYCNDQLYVAFRVEGIEKPSNLTGLVKAWQKKNQAVSFTSASVTNGRTTRGYCINYPFKANGTFPYFYFYVYGSDIDQSKFDFVNCSLNNSDVGDEGQYRINVSLTDTSSPAYITYDNFIIAVFNYTV